MSGRRADAATGPVAAARMLGRAAVAPLASGAASTLRVSEEWLAGSRKALFGIAGTRILLGVSMIGLLLTNLATRSYTYGQGAAWMADPAAAITDTWPFGVFAGLRTSDVAVTVYLAGLLVLAVLFTIGWRTRFVTPALVVFWTAFVEANDAVSDQGDNMLRIALILMCFADVSARWSVDARRRARRANPDGTSELVTTLHNLALVVLGAQVCIVYVSGALYKAGGDPWSGGTAVYSPLMTDRFGTWPALSDLVTAWGPGVAILTWSSVLVQLAFPFLLLRRPTRILGLVGIMGFHVGIGVLMGLPWFSLAMIAIDLIFIRDRTWRAVGDTLARAWRIARGARRRRTEPPNGEESPTEPAPEPAVSPGRRREPVGAR